jgi:hypothetical protein
MANLTRNHESLIIVFGCVLQLTKASMGDSQAKPGIPLAVAIANLAGNLQRLLVALDSAM